MSSQLSAADITVILESFSHSKDRIRNATRSPIPEENHKMHFIGNDKISEIERVEAKLREQRAALQPQNL